MNFGIYLLCRGTAYDKRALLETFFYILSTILMVTGRDLMTLNIDYIPSPHPSFSLRAPRIWVFCCSEAEFE